MRFIELEDGCFVSQIEFETTGRREYQHAETIGISNEGRPTFGYDGGFNDHAWNQQEREELADFMIALWTRFKA